MPFIHSVDAVFIIIIIVVVVIITYLAERANGRHRTVSCCASRREFAFSFER